MGNKENLLWTIFMIVFAIAFVALGLAMVVGGLAGQLKSVWLSVLVGAAMAVSGGIIVFYLVAKKQKKGADKRNP